MGIIKKTERGDQYAEDQAIRLLNNQSPLTELAIRQSTEQFIRQTTPESRIYHELVMGARQVRTDLAAIGIDNIAAFEIKGDHDDTRKLIHQVAMYALSVPEVWIILAPMHADDGKLINHLLPSVGIMIAEENGQLTVENPATKRDPYPEMLYEILWIDELYRIANRLDVTKTSKTTRTALIQKLIQAAPLDVAIQQVCRELRQRNVLFRSDPPIKINELN